MIFRQLPVFCYLHTEPWLLLKTDLSLRRPAATPVCDKERGTEHASWTRREGTQWVKWDLTRGH